MKTAKHPREAGAVNAKINRGGQLLFGGRKKREGGGGGQLLTKNKIREV